MNAHSPPPGARIAYIQSLVSNPTQRTGGIYPYRARFFIVRDKQGTRQLRWLRPFVLRTKESFYQEERWRYPRLLLTRKNRLVRGEHTGDAVYYTCISLSELTDEEIRELTIAIRGQSGLTSPDYLRIINPTTDATPGDTP